MTTYADTTQLTNILTELCKVIDRKPSKLPILNNVLLSAEAGKLQAGYTNLTRSKVLTIPATGDDLAGTVPPRKLLEWLKIAGEGVARVALEWLERDQCLQVTAGRIRLTLQGITAQEYPDMTRKAKKAKEKDTRYNEPSVATFPTATLRELAKVSDTVVIDTDGEDVEAYGVKVNVSCFIRAGKASGGPAGAVALPAKDLAKMLGKGKETTIVFNGPQQVFVNDAEFDFGVVVTPEFLKQARALSVDALVSARVGALDVLPIIPKNGKVTLRLNAEKQVVEVGQGENRGEVGAKVKGESRWVELSAKDLRAMFSGMERDCWIKLGAERMEIEEA